MRSAKGLAAPRRARRWSAATDAAGRDRGPSGSRAGAAQYLFRRERRRWLRFAPALERSEEHTSELQSLMRISYAVFCLKKKNVHSTHIWSLATAIYSITIP